MINSDKTDIYRCRWRYWRSGNDCWVLQMGGRTDVGNGVAATSYYHFINSPII